MGGEAHHRVAGPGGRPSRVAPEDEQRIIDAARAVIALGPKSKVRWHGLAKRHGVTAYWLRHRLDPDWADGTRDRVKHNRRSRAGLEVKPGPSKYTRSEGAAAPLSDEELKRRKALIPEDTRDLTSRFFGDPIPNDPRRMQA